jgi:predicted transcriptional regulator
LQILWERGPSTVREVLGVLDKERAYTSVMSLLNVMADKKLVVREPEGRAFRYAPRHRPDQTQRKLLSDLLRRAFDGSASALVARLLEQSRPTAQELDAIQKLIEDYQKLQGGGK